MAASLEGRAFQEGEAMRFLQRFARPLLVTIVAFTIPDASQVSGASGNESGQPASGPEAGTAVEYAISPPARQLAPPAVGSPTTFRPPRINPLAGEPDGGQRGTWNRPSVPLDPLIQAPVGVNTPTPPPRTPAPKVWETPWPAGAARAPPRTGMSAPTTMGR